MLQRNWSQVSPKRSVPHIVLLSHIHPLTNAHILKEHRYPLALPPSLTFKHTHRSSHKNASKHIRSQTPANVPFTLQTQATHTTSLSHRDSSTHLLRCPHQATDTPPPMKSQMTHSLTGQQSQTHNHCHLHHRQARTHSSSEAGIVTVREDQDPVHTREFPITCTHMNARIHIYHHVANTSTVHTYIRAPHITIAPAQTQSETHMFTTTQILPDLTTPARSRSQAHPG